MNCLTMHVPSFVDCSGQRFYFETITDLIKVPWVRQFLEDDGARLVKSADCLMQLTNDGFRWWVVGYLKYPELVDLPVWEGPKLKQTTVVVGASPEAN